MRNKPVVSDYFHWLSEIAIPNKVTREWYSKLLDKLHSTIFRYSIPRDRNRVEDGIDLRWRYACEVTRNDAERTRIVNQLYIQGGMCTVLELMVALAMRIDETIMDDPTYGDRTSQWFWNMVTSLGLNQMVDEQYDDEYATMVLDRFMDHKYDQDGRGGLFTIENCDRNIRTAEIWYQLCWYIDSIAWKGN